MIGGIERAGSIVMFIDVCQIDDQNIVGVGVRV
jgi:hypothetical protein